MSAAELVVYGLALVSAIAAAAAVSPMLLRLFTRSVSTVEQYQQERVDQAAKALDEIFVEVKPAWLKMAYGLGPLLAGVAGFLLFNSVMAAVVGAVLGLVLPDLWVRQRRAARKRKFRSQLVDAMFMLSSSLRAGLSLTQAFEVLESEMPPPASQEFGLMMKAHKVGRTLEESLARLNQRMACEEMHLVTTAVTVARETGGDLTTIVNTLIGTIRDKRKLAERVSTLTLQGRLQAYIMSGLPMLFAGFVLTFNPRYFDPLFTAPSGKTVIAVAVGLWAIGMVLLLRLSKVEV